MMRLFRRPDGRYYAILPPARDLLGDWVLVTFHGSSQSRRGGCKTYVAASGDGLREIERQMIRARLRHGYVAPESAEEVPVSH